MLMGLRVSVERANYALRHSALVHLSEACVEHGNGWSDCMTLHFDGIR